MSYQDSLVEVVVIKTKHERFINYCYFVFDSKTKDAVLIDPAWEQNKIEHMLSVHDVTVKAILLTHHHFDHVHLAEPMAMKFVVPVYMSQQEISYYQYQCNNLVSIPNEEVLNIGSLLVTPILTPGHTKGCNCYLIGSNLFTGDVLFNEGCGICKGNGSDPAEMFLSLNKIKNIVTPTTRIYAGHSYGSSPGQFFSKVLNDNIYLNFTDMESFINFRMRINQKTLFNFI